MYSRKRLIEPRLPDSRGKSNPYTLVQGFCNHHLTESQPTHQTAEDQTRHIDGRDPPWSKGPTLNVLIEIDPELRRGRDDVVYEIASDTLSPTTTVSSIETDEPEEEDDVKSPSRPFELVRLPTGSEVFQG